ncbi:MULTISPECIES: hypothetical protein [unclassified Streptomyces]|uniref:hypothetical protein n=1 Tax=unclassified Streptomyces TaxID=2593676 RepID=UPI0036CBE73C
MIQRLVLSILGNRKLLQLAVRCWAVVTDGLVRPGVRIAGGVAAVASGICALAYFVRFRTSIPATRAAVEKSDDLTGDPGNVLDILQLLSFVWLVSGIVLITMGLMVSFARYGGLLLIVGGVAWWAPLGFLGLRLPGAPGLHLLSGIFLALVIPAAVLCPAQRFAGGARRRQEHAPDEA